MEKIDVYLSRSSQLVQIGLFVITIFTVFYTVIPLYKSAQLEESLARREVELEKLKNRSDEILKKVNGWEYKQFVQLASQCSGMPKVFLDGGNPEIGNHPPVEVESCLRATQSNFSFTELSAEQQMVIQGRITRIVSGLQGVYQKSLNDYDDYPDMLDRQLLEGNAPKSSIDQIDQMLNDLGHKISDNQKRESYISMGRMEIQYAYFRALMNAIVDGLGEKI